MARIVRTTAAPPPFFRVFRVFRGPNSEGPIFAPFRVFRGQKYRSLVPTRGYLIGPNSTLRAFRVVVCFVAPSVLGVLRFVLRVFAFKSYSPDLPTRPTRALLQKPGKTKPATV